MAAKESPKEARRISTKLCECGCGQFVQRAYWRFASVQCQKDHQYRQWVERWLAGDEDGVRGGIATSNHIRRWLIETRGERCECVLTTGERCGWCEINPYTGKIPLTVEHRDGNAMNNRPENLMLLCPNHHSLTATYAGANRGKGRAVRRQRYAQVLS